MTDTAHNSSHLGVLLPSQHSQPSRQPMPERRLMVAVLNEALDCLTKYRAATDMKGRRDFVEAQQWLLADEPEWPYSFASICEVLGLDVAAVRKRVLADRCDAASRPTVTPRPVGDELQSAVGSLR